MNNKTTNQLNPTISWEQFHKLWTKCVGSPTYDKKAWQSIERQLVENNLMNHPR